MKILLYGKTISQSQLPSVQLLLDLLTQEQAEICIYAPYLEVIAPLVSITAPIQKIQDYDDLIREQPDYVFTLGGDGTILSAATLIRDSNIPIVGINLGRLGFLASIEQKVIREAFQKIKVGQYRLEERSMIYLDSSSPIFGDNLFALNDFTILKRDNSSMIIIHTFINGEFLNSYWADGLIVSTPDGFYRLLP